MKVLCVTHSERSFLEARCDINFLEKRFPEDRLTQEVPFQKIQGIKEAVPYDGSLSLWKVSDDYSISFLKSYSPDYKVQFASFYNDLLVVYGSDRIEILNTHFECIRTIEGPRISGGHTLHFDEKGMAWINSAPGNMVMKVDINSGKIVETIKMPSRYGDAVEFESKDIREHYIPTDLQPTHVNCAYPHKNSIYVTLWIQGAVGVYDENRSYREILNGFRGIHSGKIDSHTGLLYFTDSPLGTIWFYDMEREKLFKRFKFNSRWVHDTDHIDKGVFAAGLSDENSVKVFSISEMEVIGNYSMGSFGKSVMFLNCCKVSEPWDKVLIPEREYSNGEFKKYRPRINIIPRIHNPLFWNPCQDVSIKSTRDTLREDAIFVASNKRLVYEFVFQSEVFTLPKGTYRVDVDIECQIGSVSIGIINKGTNSWKTQIYLDQSFRSISDEFLVDDSTEELLIVVASNNSERKEYIEIFIHKIRIEVIGVNAEDKIQMLFEKYDIKKTFEKLTDYTVKKEKEVRELIRIIKGS